MFLNRVDAGRKLAQALLAYKSEPAVVYALPRGGVVLGVEVARALDAPLDLIVVRKIGHPFQPEYAIGAIAEDGYLIMNPSEAAAVNKPWLDSAVAAERSEAQRRRSVFLQSRDRVSAKDKTAIIVDDGLATGLTMEAAIHQARERGARKVVVAVPVAPEETVAKLRPEVDDLVVLQIPHGWFGAIGEFYSEFDQVSDREVIDLLKSLSGVLT